VLLRSHLVPAVLACLAAACAVFSPTPVCSADGKLPQAKSSPGRTDRYGDPLPPGALARFGATRLPHRTDVSALAFAPDGQSLFSGTAGGVIRRWSVPSRQELPLARIQHYPLVALQAVRDVRGRVLLVTTSLDSVRVWDAATGRLVGEVEPEVGPLHAVALSPDGRLVAAAGLIRRVKLWDLATGKLVRELPHPAPPGKVAFAPNGKTLATACLDGAVRLWDPHTGAEQVRCAGHRGVVHQVAFACGGRFLVSCGGDDTLRVWDPATGKPLGRADLGPAGALALATPAGDRRLVAAHADGSLRVWELPACREHARLGGPAGKVAVVALSPDGKLLAVASGTAVCLWDVDARKELAPAPWHPTGVRTVAFTPDGRTLASAGNAGEIWLWDVATQKPLREIRTLPEMGECLGFLAGGKALLTAGTTQGAARVWDVATGREIRSFRMSSDPDRLSLLSADGGTLFVQEGPCTLIFLDPVTGKKRKRLTVTSDPVNREWVIGPDGRTAGSIGIDGAVRILAVETGKERVLVPGVAERNPDLLHRYLPAFSPDGRFLTVVSSELRGTVELWDTARGVIRWPPESGANGVGVCKLVVSPDGKILALVDMPGTRICLLEVVTGRMCGFLEGLAGKAMAFAFSPDGKTLAVGWPDGTVLLWPVDGFGDPIPPKGDLSQKSLQALWEDLAGEDAARALCAIGTLARAPGRTLPFLAGRLQRQSGPDPEQLARTIADLDSERFATRQEAERRLRRWGKLAEAALQKALAGRPSEEVRRRLEQLLRRLDGDALSPEQLRQYRAVTLLERAGTPEARHLLEDLARGALGARLTQDARASLQRLARRTPGTP
jgi:WD40 repeat protein